MSERATFRFDTVIQIRDLVTVGLVVVTILVWGLRLEAKVAEQAKDILSGRDILELKLEAQKTRTEQLATDIRNSLDDIKSTLIRIQQVKVGQ